MVRRVLAAVLVGMATVLAIDGCAHTSAHPLEGLPEHARVYVIGDSWSAGFAATPSKTFPIVASLALGWTVTMNAVSGTGYAKAFVAGTSTFEQRAKALPEGQRADLVLLQGSTNDEAVPASTLKPAVARTMALVRDRFRGAEIVMVGPGLYVGSDQARVTALDRTLAAAAQTAGVPYISMMQEEWINSSNISTVIGLSSQHPTEEGDAYLGGRLAADLRALG